MHGMVSIFHNDGTVAISHGGIEMGQGLNTKAVQMAALTLGIPMEKIAIKPNSSFISANDAATAASVASEVVCYITKHACDILVERLRPFREANANGTWEEIVRAAYLKDVDLVANYTFKAEEVNSYYVYGLSCAEVEVDILTGNLILQRVDILEDTGESLSPGMDIGQVEGAFVMGLGIWLTENIVYAKDGELLTNRTWNYKPPGPKDIPVDFRVKFLQKTPNPFFMLRSKGKISLFI